ncbi:MAG: zinc-ribbon domain-containing protein [Holophaga sp.]|nr:zinc-ribbon domain-containing protein [Holophaga sp.]
MLESISCPSCSTHYGLRPERVNPGLRRARCYRCAELFDIEQAVAHLLGPMVATEESPVLVAAPVANLMEAELQPDVFHSEDASAEPSPAEVVQADDFLDLDLSVLTSSEPENPDAALSLSDLESSEDEIFDKTLLIEPSQDTPSEMPTASPEPESNDGSGGFASAKDAIAKLLGEAPAPDAAVDRRMASPSRNTSMDVEATLNALEHTLGGTPVADHAVPASGSTVRLSNAELMAAMVAGAPALPTAQPQPQAATVPVMAISAPAIKLEASQASDPNLLKIQIGQDTYQNVTLDQVSAWIEHGRVQDFHMVARQFSDNWIEAGKVPSLRPIFERMRRPAQAPTAPREPLGPPPESAPVKKGLFGWMSGRN